MLTVRLLGVLRHHCYILSGSVRRKMELQKFNKAIIVPTKYTKACENRSKSVMQLVIQLVDLSL